MPYSNLPKHLWGKMERCVADLKKKGGVDNVYAVCYSSVMKEDRARRFVSGLLEDGVEEMTTTGDIATAPMGLGTRSDYDSDEVTPKDPEVAAAPTDLGPNRKR